MQRSTSQQEDPRKAGTSCHNAVRAYLLLGVGCLLSVGCGGQNGVSTEVIHGTVTVGGQTPETGRLRFVPIEGTPGPASTGRIVDGQYRIEARGGVPVGKHRVEVTAQPSANVSSIRSDIEGAPCHRGFEEMLYRIN